ncbi:MAG TPA: Uma2 family endonuclease [Bryobacteraceae bacterium]|jgi:Uma2 family endonuclease
MSAGTLISVEEYLRTSYRPDREYRDGVLVERNVGKKAHARLQILLGRYFCRFEKEWRIRAYTEMRIRARAGWYPIPDLCVYSLPEPEGEVPTVMPLLWVEILSDDDRIMDVWNKAKDLIACGAPYVWIINPHTLDSELFTQEGGPKEVPDKTLRIPDTPIVVPLTDVVEED